MCPASRPGPPMSSRPAPNPTTCQQESQHSGQQQKMTAAGGEGGSPSRQSQRELDIYQRPFATRAADLERSAQGLHPVAEADQARAAGRIDATHPVVANREVEAVVSLLDRDAYDRRVRVPGRVG